MKNRGMIIFLLMQVFFVVFGFVLFFGLKALKESQREQPAAVQPAAGTQPETQTPKDMIPACDFMHWVGTPVDEEALKETGRPYRILPPGSMATMDFNPERINVHTDERGTVVDVRCG